VDVIVFPQDVTNIVLLLAGCIVYANIFFKGSMIKKLSAVIIFYTIVTALNYFTQDLGFQIFLLSSDESDVYATLVHTLTMGTETKIAEKNPRKAGTELLYSPWRSPI